MWNLVEKYELLVLRVLWLNHNLLLIWNWLGLQLEHHKWGLIIQILITICPSPILFANDISEWCMQELPQLGQG